LAVSGPELGAMQVGPGTPDWMINSDGALAGAGTSAAFAA